MARSVTIAYWVDMYTCRPPEYNSWRVDSYVAYIEFPRDRRLRQGWRTLADNVVYAAVNEEGEPVTVVVPVIERVRGGLIIGPDTALDDVVYRLNTYRNNVALRPPYSLTSLCGNTLPGSSSAVFVQSSGSIRPAFESDTVIVDPLESNIAFLESLSSALFGPPSTQSATDQSAASFVPLSGNSYAAAVTSASAGVVASSTVTDISVPSTAVFSAQPSLSVTEPAYLSSNAASATYGASTEVQIPALSSRSTGLADDQTSQEPQQSAGVSVVGSSVQGSVTIVETSGNSAQPSAPFAEHGRSSSSGLSSTTSIARARRSSNSSASSPAASTQSETVCVPFAYDSPLIGGDLDEWHDLGLPTGLEIYYLCVRYTGQISPSQITVTYYDGISIQHMLLNRSLAAGEYSYAFPVKLSTVDVYNPRLRIQVSNTGADGPYSVAIDCNPCPGAAVSSSLLSSSSRGSSSSVLASSSSSNVAASSAAVARVSSSSLTAASSSTSAISTSASSGPPQPCTGFAFTAGVGEPLEAVHPWISRGTPEVQCVRVSFNVANSPGRVQIYVRDGDVVTDVLLDTGFITTTAPVVQLIDVVVGYAAQPNLLVLVDTNGLADCVWELEMTCDCAAEEFCGAPSTSAVPAMARLCNGVPFVSGGVGGMSSSFPVDSPICLEIDLNTYTIMDQLLLLTDTQQVLLDTGFVSGTHTYMVCVPACTREVTLLINAPDPNTAWNVAVACHTDTSVCGAGCDGARLTPLLNPDDYRCSSGEPMALVPEESAREAFNTIDCLGEAAANCYIFCGKYLTLLSDGSSDVAGQPTGSSSGAVMAAGCCFIRPPDLDCYPAGVVGTSSNTVAGSTQCSSAAPFIALTLEDAIAGYNELNCQFMCGSSSNGSSGPAPCVGDTCGRYIHYICDIPTDSTSAVPPEASSSALNTDSSYIACAPSDEPDVGICSVLCTGELDVCSALIALSGHISEYNATAETLVDILEQQELCDVFFGRTTCSTFVQSLYYLLSGHFTTELTLCCTPTPAQSASGRSSSSSHSSNSSSGSSGSHSSNSSSGSSGSSNSSSRSSGSGFLKASSSSADILPPVTGDTCPALPGYFEYGCCCPVVPPTISSSYISSSGSSGSLYSSTPSVSSEGVSSTEQPQGSSEYDSSTNVNEVSSGAGTASVPGPTEPPDPIYPSNTPDPGEPSAAQEPSAAPPLPELLCDEIVRGITSDPPITYILTPPPNSSGCFTLTYFFRRLVPNLATQVVIRDCATQQVILDTTCTTTSRVTTVDFHTCSLNPLCVTITPNCNNITTLVHVSYLIKVTCLVCPEPRLPHGNACPCCDLPSSSGYEVSSGIFFENISSTAVSSAVSSGRSSRLSSGLSSASSGLSSASSGLSSASSGLSSEVSSTPSSEGSSAGSSSDVTASSSDVTASSGSPVPSTSAISASLVATSASAYTQSSRNVTDSTQYVVDYGNSSGGSPGYFSVLYVPCNAE